MCARVDPMKDHPTFVEAATVLTDAAPEARFVLIGAGTDEPGSALDRAIAASGIGGRFVRLGRRRDVGRLHATLDIAALSSAFGEGFPNVLAEAMACGVPCVATDVGDSASIVGDTGLIVPPGDAQALAAAWVALRCEGRDTRAARGAAARRRVADRYALATMIEAYGALYRELAMSDRAHARTLNHTMCGFVGFIGAPGALDDDALERLAARMAARLESRGPDDAGTLGLAVDRYRPRPSPPRHHRSVGGRPSADGLGQRAFGHRL